MTDVSWFRNRIVWLLQDREKRDSIGKPVFYGPTARLLIALGACPGDGDRIGIVSPPKGGKSRLMSAIINEIQPGTELVVILSERPEEITDFLELVDQTRGRYFIAQAEDSPLRRLKTVELGMQHVMRRLEVPGTRLLVVVDSLTKVMADAINILPTPEGVGTLPGGINPLMDDLISIFFSVGGRRPNGSSCTIMVGVLDRGDDQSTRVVYKTEDVGLGVITLDARMAAAGVYPAIHCGRRTRHTGGGRQEDIGARSGCRRMPDWAPSQWVRDGEQLRMHVSVEAAERQVRHEADDRRQSIRDNALAESLAVVRAADRLRKLVEMCAKMDVPMEHIFDHFLHPERLTAEKPDVDRTTAPTPVAAAARTAPGHYSPRDARGDRLRESQATRHEPVDAGERDGQMPSAKDVAAQMRESLATAGGKRNDGDAAARSGLSAQTSGAATPSVSEMPLAVVPVVASGAERAVVNGGAPSLTKPGAPPVVSLEEEAEVLAKRRAKEAEAAREWLRS